MNFTTFCEENDKLMRELQNKLNEIEEKKSLFDESIQIEMYIEHESDVDQYIEEFGLSEEDKEQAIDLAKEEVVEYDTRYITEDLGINTRNIEWNLSESYDQVSIYPLPTDTKVADYIKSDLHFFDFATEESLISINGSQPQEDLTVLDYEDGFNHDKVNFSSSEEVYKPRMEGEDGYQFEDEMWDEELKISQDIYDDLVNHILKPFLEAIHDVEKAFDAVGDTVDFDITDCVLGQLEDFETDED